MSILLYRESGQVRLEGMAELIPLDTYVAEVVTRGADPAADPPIAGVERVLIRHATQGTWDDENEVWENILTYSSWDMYRNNLNVQYGVDATSTVIALNLLLSSP